MTDLLAQTYGPRHAGTLVGVVFLCGSLLCAAIFPLAALTNTALGGDWTAVNASTLAVALAGSFVALYHLNRTPVRLTATSTAGAAVVALESRTTAAT